MAKNRGEHEHAPAVDVGPGISVRAAGAPTPMLRDRTDEYGAAPAVRRASIPTACAIGFLEPGTRFQLAAIPERCGVLVRLGESAAVVRYGEPTHVALPNGREFEASPRDVTISLKTLVIAVPECER